jgi:hypothetical protein
LRFIMLTGLLLVLAGMTGCSGGRCAVEGLVTYDGEPIAIGTIAFLPKEEKGIKCGGRIENGRYIIEAQFGPVPGPHRVEIHWAKPTGVKYKNEFGEVFDRTKEGLPDKYHSKSTLSADIKSGTNTLDFKLDK